jgi:peroxiredoxin Q/BCP
LNFKLLADTSGEVAKEYGSLTNMGVVKFAARHTFVSDPAGMIVRVYKNVDPVRHSDEVLAGLDQLRKQPGPSQ